MIESFALVGLHDSDIDSVWFLTHACTHAHAHTHTHTHTHIHTHTQYGLVSLPPWLTVSRSVSILYLEVSQPLSLCLMHDSLLRLFSLVSTDWSHSLLLVAQPCSVQGLPGQVCACLHLSPKPTPARITFSIMHGVA